MYTTLDMNLQRDAVEAVRIGIQETDTQWKRRSKKYGTDEMPLAQVALVVLDTETGKVKALVGGRSYANSQLNHAIAEAAAGIVVQAVRVYGGVQRGAAGRRPGDHAGDHGRG